MGVARIRVSAEKKGAAEKEKRQIGHSGIWRE
jgi:hypothetical protein